MNLETFDLAIILINMYRNHLIKFNGLIVSINIFAFLCNLKSKGKKNCSILIIAIHAHFINR